MKSPEQTWRWIKSHIKQEWKTAFVSAVLFGLLIHMPILLSDIPNHDGLDSIYFDQNMITSGRWFLTIACGFSSYYTLPWVIGLIAIFNLALAGVALTEFLEVKSKGCIVLISGLLVSFPAVASTFAYVFTMDGYMLALFLAILSVLLTARFKWGFLGGMVCLALSMGTYQAYLPFAVLLSIYGILMLAMSEMPFKEKLQRGARYLYMGALGSVLYYVVLQLLLRLQGKTLDDYQGINGMGSIGEKGLFSILKSMYHDFFAFTLKGNVLFHNIFSIIALILLAGLTLFTFIRLIVLKKWWRSPWFYCMAILLAAGLPVAANLILLISPDVNYHLLMRYQWVLFLILMIAFVSRYSPAGTMGMEAVGTFAGTESNREISGRVVRITPDTGCALRSWCLLTAAAVLVVNYAVTDNIAYSNLAKRYEKTYAYCIRLLDRIEQTEGYYQGIPIAMVGVVGNEEFPTTDITGAVTSGMIGITGDSLLYRGDNYELFIRHYLGATLNILPAEAMTDAYYADFYRKMGSFPAEDSIQIVDGIMYIKTENIE